MKVIDLLNKIAKGEEVPKNIEVSGELITFKFTFDKNRDLYLSEHHKTLGEIFDLSNMLNNEVEIIEEKPKHIEELNISRLRKNEYCYPITVEIMAKINELSKAVNYLLDKDE